MIDQFIDKKRVFQDVVETGTCLSAGQISSFNRDGYLVIRGAMPPAELVPLRAAADQLFAGIEGEWIGGPELRDSRLARYSQSDIVRGVIGDLNGESAVLLGFLYRKQRSYPQPKQWHQDAVYWDHSDGRIMALFTPLTPIHADNGALHIIPGSHRLGRLFHRPAQNNYSLYCDASPFRDPHVIELEPGDVMALHGLTLHYSPENPSDQDRINFGLHFYNVETKIVRDEPTAVLYEGAV